MKIFVRYFTYVEHELRITPEIKELEEVKKKKVKAKITKIAQVLKHFRNPLTFLLDLSNNEKRTLKRHSSITKMTCSILSMKIGGFQN